MSFENIGLICEGTEFLQDKFLRKKVNEILVIRSTDKYYAEFLLNNLIHFYIKDKYNSLYNKLKEEIK